MKLLLVFLCISFPVITFASWNGVWVGKGNAFTPKYVRPCQFIEIRFFIDGDNLILRGGGYKCGDLSAEYPYSQMKIDRGQILYRGEVVGKISNNSLSLTANDGEFLLELFKANNIVVYREKWQGEGKFLVVDGLLKQGLSIQN